MKILLDDKVVEALAPESLPMLIHGKEGLGASLYTIVLATKWFSQGYSILCLCGFPMAEEKFNELVDRKKGDAIFYTHDKVLNFVKEVVQKSNNRIIIIKNIELFNEDILNVFDTTENVIISGDILKTNFKDKILQKKFITSVYFSEFPDINTSKLRKYEGLVKSGNYEGITKLD